MTCEQNGNIIKETENLKKYQNEILELKSIVTKMKKTLQEFKARFEQAEESISKL